MSYLRFWEVDHPAEGETCLGQQPNNTCQAVAIPKCVDRNVYCSAVPAPANASVLTLPVDNNPQKVGTVIQFTCPDRNWFFNYSVPANLISFYYSTNINVTSVTCNTHGSVRLTLMTTFFKSYHLFSKSNLNYVCNRWHC